LSFISPLNDTTFQDVFLHSIIHLFYSENGILGPFVSRCLLKILSSQDGNCGYVRLGFAAPMPFRILALARSALGKYPTRWQSHSSRRIDIIMSSFLRLGLAASSKLVFNDPRSYLFFDFNVMFGYNPLAKLVVFHLNI
jgi:hypothetical protein